MVTVQQINQQKDAIQRALVGDFGTSARQRRNALDTLDLALRDLRRGNQRNADSRFNSISRLAVFGGRKSFGRGSPTGLPKQAVSKTTFIKEGSSQRFQRIGGRLTPQALETQRLTQAVRTQSRLKDDDGRESGKLSSSKERITRKAQVITLKQETKLEKFANFIKKRDLVLQEKGVSEKKRLQEARVARKEFIRRSPRATRKFLTGVDIGIRSGEIGFGIGKGFTTGFGRVTAQAVTKATFLGGATIENIKSGEFKSFFKELTKGEAATVAASSLAIVKRSKQTGRLEVNFEGVANITAAAALALIPVGIQSRGKVIKGKPPKSGSKLALKESGTVFVNKGKSFVVNAKGKVINVAKTKANVRAIRSEISKLSRLQTKQLAKANVLKSNKTPSVGSKSKPSTLFVNEKTGTVRVSDINGRVFKVGNIRDLKGSIARKVGKVVKKSKVKVDSITKSKQQATTLAQKQGFKDLKQKNEFNQLLNKISDASNQIRSTRSPRNAGERRVLDVLKSNLNKLDSRAREISSSAFSKKKLLSKLKAVERVKPKKGLTKTEKLARKQGFKDVEQRVSFNKLVKQSTKLDKKITKIKDPKSALSLVEKRSLKLEINKINKDIVKILRDVNKRKNPDLFSKLQKKLKEFEAFDKLKLSKLKKERVKVDIKAQKQGFKDAKEFLLREKLENQLFSGNKVQQLKAKVGLKSLGKKIRARKGIKAKAQANKIDSLVKKAKSGRVITKRTTPKPRQLRKPVKDIKPPRKKITRLTKKQTTDITRILKKIKLTTKKRIEQPKKQPTTVKPVLKKVSKSKSKKVAQKRKIKLSSSRTRALLSSPQLASLISGNTAFTVTTTTGKLIDLRKVKNIEDIKPIIIESTAIGNIQAIKALNKIDQVIKEKQTPVVKTTTRQKQDVKTSPKEKNIIKAAQRQKPKVAGRQKSTSKAKKPKSKIIIVPPPPKFDKRKKSKKKTQRGFIGQARGRGKKLPKGGFKKGKFIPVGKSTTRNRASKQAGNVVNNTVSQTMRVIKGKMIKKKKDIKKANVLRLFGKANKKGERRELPKARINTRGEKLGITVKGLLARRAKARGGVSGSKRVKKGKKRVNSMAKKKSPKKDPLERFFS